MLQINLILLSLRQYSIPPPSHTHLYIRSRLIYNTFSWVFNSYSEFLMTYFKEHILIINFFYNILNNLCYSEFVLMSFVVRFYNCSHPKMVCDVNKHVCAHIDILTGHYFLKSLSDFNFYRNNIPLYKFQLVI